MRNAIDISGQRFGKLVAVERSGSAKDNAALWKCKCDCGNTIVTRARSLIVGHTKSCGCSRKTDLIGQKFGRLTVVEYSHKDKRGNYTWKCLCECGGTTFATTKSLRKGDKRSCGCLHKIAPQSRKNAGVKKHPLYKLYRGIKTRCYCETDIHYKDYGGRGIKLADEWMDSFWDFARYLEALPHCHEIGYSLDRIDVNGNYAPGNVRWATAKTQTRNKRNNALATAFGETKTIADWAEEYGINYYTLWSRINKRHMETEKALTTPVDISKRTIKYFGVQGRDIKNA